MQRKMRGDGTMTAKELIDRLQRTTIAYDVTNHPFCRALIHGQLTREDLQMYARDQYQYVELLSRSVAEYVQRLPFGEIHEAWCANLNRLGKPGTPDLRPHLWLDFAEGIGAGRQFLDYKPTAELGELLSFLDVLVLDGRSERVLSALHVCESQLSSLAAQVLVSLSNKYRLDAKTCAYFQWYATEGSYYSQSWHYILEKSLQKDPIKREATLFTVEMTACLLWNSFNGIERVCIERVPEVW